MKIKELFEMGGWASDKVLDSHITPATVEQVIKILNNFAHELNIYLETKNLPLVEMGNPCGSATYYKRDLVQNPTREYGDVDVNFHIPKLDGLSNNEIASTYKKAIIEFCQTTKNYETENGTNIILNIDDNFVQVDLITSFIDNKEWTKALAPEYNVKGVLCNSLYSALGQVLNLSIGGGHGIQAKKYNNRLVPFKTNKNVELITITTNPKTWALDIAKFFGAKPSRLLLKYPGMLDEVKITDIISSIKGIASSLEQSGKIGSADQLINKIVDIYKSKIESAIKSSKYDKAGDNPIAIAKANKTKKLLKDKLDEILRMF